MNMAVLRGRKKMKHEAKEQEIVQRKSIFGKYSDVEMLSQLRELALDPCKSGVSKESIRPLWNQTIRVRKLMTLTSSECPQVNLGLKQIGENVSLPPVSCAHTALAKAQRRSGVLSILFNSLGIFTAAWSVQIYNIQKKNH